MCVLIFFEKLMCILINITIYFKKKKKKKKQREILFHFSLFTFHFLFGKYSYNDHDETYINGSLYPLITLKLLLA